MIRAVQLADRCGNDGWSKVSLCTITAIVSRYIFYIVLFIVNCFMSQTHEKGWQEVCGKHHTDLLKEPIPLHDLKENILRAQKKTDELVKVRVCQPMFKDEMLSYCSFRSLTFSSGGDFCTDSQDFEAAIHNNLLRGLAR
jgi:hypothetical protein